MEICLIVSFLENRRGLMFKPFCGPCIYTSGSLWNRLLDEGIASLSAASFLWQAKRNVKKNYLLRSKKDTSAQNSYFLPGAIYLHPVTPCRWLPRNGPRWP